MIDVADVKSNENYSTLILTLDGSVYGVGRNYYYNLANVGGAVPQPISSSEGLLSGITGIAIGNTFAYAITSDEKLFTWGYNGYGQLSQGNTNSYITSPTYAKDENNNEIENVMLVNGGYYHTELAKNDGTVWSTGYNGYGQLGDGSTSQTSLLKKISTSYIDVNERKVTVHLSDKEYQINAKTSFGFNLLYESEANDNLKFESLNPDIAEVNEITGKVTLKATGKTYVNISQKNGDSKTRVTINVIPDENKNAEKISSDHTHTLALKQNGTIWTFGEGYCGASGLGNSDNVLDPTQIKYGYYQESTETTSEDGKIVTTNEQKEIELNNMVDVATGIYYSMAVDNNGNVYTWGYNGYGQLGHGNTKIKFI